MPFYRFLRYFHTRHESELIFAVFVLSHSCRFWYVCTHHVTKKFWDFSLTLLYVDVTSAEKKRKNANEPTLLFFSVNYGWWVLLPSLKVAVVARGWNFSSQEGEFSPFIILDVEKAPATLVCGLFFNGFIGERGVRFNLAKRVRPKFLWLKLQLPRRRSVAKNTWIQMT